eukprot:356188-Chlamydomonas_euryale.AAC.20
MPRIAHAFPATGDTLGSSGSSPPGMSTSTATDDSASGLVTCTVSDTMDPRGTLCKAGPVGLPVSGSTICSEVSTQMPRYVGKSSSSAGSKVSMAAMLASPRPTARKSREPGGDGRDSHGVLDDAGTDLLELNVASRTVTLPTATASSRSGVVLPASSSYLTSARVTNAAYMGDVPRYRAGCGDGDAPPAAMYAANFCRSKDDPTWSEGALSSNINASACVPMPAGLLEPVAAAMYAVRPATRIDETNNSSVSCTSGSLVLRACNTRDVSTMTSTLCLGASRTSRSSERSFNTSWDVAHGLAARSLASVHMVGSHAGPDASQTHAMA